MLAFGYNLDAATGEWHRCSSAGRRLTNAENTAVDAELHKRARNKARRLRRRTEDLAHPTTSTDSHGAGTD
jgi:hypothetical protein